MASQRKSGSKPKSRKAGQTGQDEPSRSWLRHPLTIALIPVIVGATLTALFVHISNRQPSSSPKLELDSVEVQAANKAYASSDGTKTLSEKVYFSLRNTGSQLAIIRAVSIRIDYFVRLPICFTQGDLPTTGHYTANLPLNPRLGSVINVPVSQQAPPDSADRFEIKLRIPPDLKESIYMYRLHLSLLYDNRKLPVDAGDVLVSLPYDPTPQQYVWNRTYQAKHGKPMYFMGRQITEISKCMIANSKKVRSLLSLSGIRSPGLASLPSVLSYCCAVSLSAEVPLLGVPWGVGQKGYGQPHPSTIFNGGDPTGLVNNIRWQSWGGQTAVGEGTALYTPGIVADGHDASARVVAFDLGMCNGYRAYTAIEWYFPQHGQSFDPSSYIDICTGRYVGNG